MDGFQVLLFVEFTKDFNKTSMILKKISKELVDHGHSVTVLDTEAFELLAASKQHEVSRKDQNNNRKANRVSAEIATAKDCIVKCDVMLFISPKNMPVLPKSVSTLIRNVNSVIFNRWCLQGVSCFVIAKQVKKAVVAQYIWKLLRKFEWNGLHNALAPWRCYDPEGMKNIQETPLPSV